jgi:hypothetical protein
VALYSDRHSIFRINTRDADPEAETQFSRAARELDIECIHANSPQAKGRVERANQTLQDRLNEAAIAEKHPSATSFNNIIHPHPERDFFCTLP